MGEQAVLYSMVPLLQAAEVKSLGGHAAAIGAYNVNFYAQAEGILEGLASTDAPGIIQASKGANKFQGGPEHIQEMVLAAMAARDGVTPITLHLDHGTGDSPKQCLDKGFSSVMIDASTLPEEENIAATKEVSAYAHKTGRSTEGEYGLLKGVEEDIVHEKTTYADPARVPHILIASGADALAIAYGTSHGANKGKTDALNLAIVDQSYQGLVKARVNMFKFLVSHGSSEVPQAFVDMINKYGGTLKGASGVPGYMVVRAIANGMRKVNIDTDLRLAMTGLVRKMIHDKPEMAEKSELVGMIKGIFDGRIKAYDKNGKEVEPGQITDPRSWLLPITEADENVLRKHYKESGDEVFIELMTAVSGVVASHVAHLNKVFGSAGLAEKVDTSLTLEEMAKKYKAA